MTAPLHETLWLENRSLAEACKRHPFVIELISGDLELERFKAYVAQDVYYLRAFVQGYALILARLEETGQQALLHELIGGALDEIRMHGRHAQELGIQLSEVVPFDATTDYVNHLLEVGWHADAAMTLAAMTPCMRLYAFLGTEAVAGDPPGPNHPYRSWIQAYSDPEFQTLTAKMEKLLDQLAEDSPRLRAVYRRSMECELAFFEAAVS